jgi:hypothetical protein
MDIGKVVRLSENDLNLSGKLRESLSAELASAELASERIRKLLHQKSSPRSELRIEVFAVTPRGADE